MNTGLQRNQRKIIDDSQLTLSAHPPTPPPSVCHIPSSLPSQREIQPSLEIQRMIRKDKHRKSSNPQRFRGEECGGGTLATAEEQDH